MWYFSRVIAKGKVILSDNTVTKIDAVGDVFLSFDFVNNLECTEWDCHLYEIREKSWLLIL